MEGLKTSHTLSLLNPRHACARRQVIPTAIPHTHTIFTDSSKRTYNTSKKERTKLTKTNKELPNQKNKRKTKNKNPTQPSQQTNKQKKKAIIDEHNKRWRNLVLMMTHPLVMSTYRRPCWCCLRWLKVVVVVKENSRYLGSVSFYCFSASCL